MCPMLWWTMSIGRRTRLFTRSQCQKHWQLEAEQTPEDFEGEGDLAQNPEENHQTGDILQKISVPFVTKKGTRRKIVQARATRKKMNQLWTLHVMKMNETLHSWSHHQKTILVNGFLILHVPITCALTSTYSRDSRSSMEELCWWVMMMLVRSKGLGLSIWRCIMG